MTSPSIKHHFTGFLWCLLFALYSNVVRAESKPVLELGLGASLLSLPDYRGSESRQLLGLPFPYIVYRGDRLKIDRNGLTQALLRNPRWSLDMSVNASPPANSDDNSARVGMPDLSPTVEVGPSLTYELDVDFDDLELTFNLPIRAVIAIDSSDIRQVGWLAQPHINLSAPAMFHQWNVGAQAGLLFGDAEYHNYYYGVGEQFEKIGRSAFDARGGYSGAMLLASLSRRFKQYWVGAFLRYDNLSGVSFRDSPLLDNEHSFMAGAGIAWIFYQSKELTTRSVHD